MPESYKRWSLTGAIGSIQNSKGSGWRSGSSPIPLTIRQETEAVSAGNGALTAATVAHMPPARRFSVATTDPTSESFVKSKMLDAGRITQDKRRSGIPRAATVSMSKSNHGKDLPPAIRKQNHLAQPDLQRPASTPPSRRHSSNTQEAARKVIERLAEIDYDIDRPLPASQLGTQGAQTSGSSDICRARKIDPEMTLVQDNLTRVGNARKQGEDTALLISAAQHNVQARMSAIDKQAAKSRGVVRYEDWDAKAIQIAQAGSDKSIKHQRKVSIGDGAYMTSNEIDAIAEKSAQPVLDDINRRVDADRARVESGRARDLEVPRTQDLQQKRERKRHKDIKRAKDIEKEEEKRAMKERKQLAKIGSKRGEESAAANYVEALHSPVSPTHPASDGSREGGIRGLINRFRKRHSRQISHDKKDAIIAIAQTEDSTIVLTSSEVHRATLSEQQHASEANGSQVIANGGPHPKPTSRIPRPMSTVTVPQTNGAINASKTFTSPRAVRSVAVAGVPPVLTNGNEKALVKRRHSLSSIGATGYYFKGKRRADGAAFSPSWAEDQGIEKQGIKKGKGGIIREKTRGFSKVTGRISGTENHSEYPDEARDTFSQQSTPFVPLSRPSSGFFPYGERRLSGEASISSRFREDL